MVRNCFVLFNGWLLYNHSFNFSPPGVLFPILHDFITKFIVSEAKSSELTASFIYSLAAISMAVSSLCLSTDNISFRFEFVLASFVVMELCVGLFNPVAGKLYALITLISYLFHIFMFMYTVFNSHSSAFSIFFRYIKIEVCT